jgi:hypothetical protein
MRRTIVAATTLAAAVLSPMLYAAGPAHAADRAAPVAAVAHEAAASRCLIWWKETTNYAGYTAGYSWAWNVVVGPGATGDRVKEIQCLTDRLSGRPASLDGVYGQDTTAAVKYVQHYVCQFPNSSDWDGIVGPLTWGCLRA